MKKFIQFFLIVLIVLIAFLINKIYFKKDKIEKIDPIDENKLLSEKQNNLIKNLKYKIEFDNNTQYIITAELSEITYDAGVEIVKMQQVKANFIDENKKILSIISRDAIYNNSTYNTEFRNDISIDYMNNTINSDNLNINFQNNTVSIYNNVFYEGPQGEIRADNVEIDLFSKKTVISMENLKKKVEVIAK